MPKVTPDYYHVLDDKDLRMNVYEPEADSFLLLDAIDELFKRLKTTTRRSGSTGEQIVTSGREGSSSGCEDKTKKQSGGQDIISFNNRENDSNNAFSQITPAATEKATATSTEEGKASSAAAAKTPPTVPLPPPPPPLVVAEIGVGSGIALCHAAYNSMLYQLETDDGSSASSQSAETDDGSSSQSQSPPITTATTTTTKAKAATVSCLGIDVNPLALAATKETFRRTFHPSNKRVQDAFNELSARTTTQQQGVVASPSTAPQPPASSSSSSSSPPSINYRLDLIRGDLLSWTRRGGRCGGAEGPVDDMGIDLLLFNPPYVPTSSEELVSATRGGDSGRDWLPSAWAGGPAGRVVLDRCLPLLPEVMAHDSHLLLVALEQNHPEEIIRRMVEIGETKGRQVVGDIIVRRWTGEKLCVIHFLFQ